MSETDIKESELWPLIQFQLFKLILKQTHKIYNTYHVSMHQGFSSLVASIELMHSKLLCAELDTNKELKLVTVEQMNNMNLQCLFYGKPSLKKKV